MEKTIPTRPATQASQAMAEISSNPQENLAPMTDYNPKTMMVIYLLLAAAGVGTGYLLSRTPGLSLMSTGQSPQNVKVIKSDKVAGITDARTFSDSAAGMIEKGGLNGEGTHKLIREGGPSQTAYLISSVIDLDEYVGKKVKVWGQTMAAKKAAWFMDVGKIEIE